MLGVIRKQQLLSEIFRNAESLTEVYVDSDFSMEHTYAVFYMLYKSKPDTLSMFRKLSDVYGDNFRFYVSQNMQDIMFENKKLLWREGTWYL